MVVKVRYTAPVSHDKASADAERDEHGYEKIRRESQKLNFAASLHRQLLRVATQ
jgi:hypothetical protein